MRCARLLAILATGLLAACWLVRADPGPIGADAGGAVDGGTKLDAGGNADGATFCESHPELTFCDDWDEGRPVDEKWFTSQQTADAASIAVDFASFVTPPGSLHVTSPPTTVSAHARLVRTVNTSPNEATLTFDVRVLEASGYVGLAELQFGASSNDSDNHVLYLAMTPNGLVYVNDQPAGSAAVETDASERLPIDGSWTHVALHMTFTPQAKVSVSLGATTVIDGPLAPGASTGPFRLYVGINGADPKSTGYGLGFDDVALTLK